MNMYLVRPCEAAVMPRIGYKITARFLREAGHGKAAELKQHS